MKRILPVFCLILSTSLLFSQEEELTPTEKNSQRIELLENTLGKLNNLKISGYIQGQWQWTERKGAKALGAGGSFGENVNNRFMVRRGRVKFTYSTKNFQAVLQPDITEKGLSLKDAYLGLMTTNKVIGGQIGVFDRPFGYEISYTSSLRESPERSRLFLSLFPGERDLGAMLMLKGMGVLADFSLDAGVFTGNGVGVETDSRKDFIGRLAWTRKFNSAEIGAAFSYYNGGIMNPDTINYTYNAEGFEVREVKQKSFELRQYFGFSAKYLQLSPIGATNIRGEFIFGSQPGTIKTNAMPGGTSIGAGTDPLYLRNFMGWYIILVQDIGQTKHSVVFKYDYYDPNTKISKHDIGRLNKTGSADIAYTTFGVGYLFRLNAAIRLMAYYDFVNNERSDNLSGYENRIKEGVFTARIQVKF